MVSGGCAVCERTYPSPMRIWPSDVWTAAPDMTEPMAAHCAPIAGPQCCSQTPIHTRIKQQCPSPSSNRSSPGTSGPVAAQGRTGGVNPSNMRLRAAGCTSPTMVANDRDSVPGQFQSLLGCASPLWGSSPRPYAYEAHALPTELRRPSITHVALCISWLLTAMPAGGLMSHGLIAQLARAYGQ